MQDLSLLGGVCESDLVDLELSCVDSVLGDLDLTSFSGDGSDNWFFITSGSRLGSGGSGLSGLGLLFSSVDP